MYFYGQKFQTITIQAKLSERNVIQKLWRFVSRTSNFLEQFRKWLETRHDQNIARKTWSDHIVGCYLKTMDLNREREALPNTNFTPTDMHHIT